jgi:hypothetical protein
LRTYFWDATRAANEPLIDAILIRPECVRIGRDLEARALAYAISRVVPEHLEEVRRQRLESIEKARAAVRDRLTKEIAYWDHRAEALRLQEQAGRPNAQLSSQEARRRADELATRLLRRIAQLDLETQISALLPLVVGGLVVVSAGLLTKVRGQPLPAGAQTADTQAAAPRPAPS